MNTMLSRYTLMSIMSIALLLQCSNRDDAQILQPEIRYKDNEDFGRICRNNLKDLTFAVNYYIRTHSGCYPESLDELYFSYNKVFKDQYGAEIKTNSIFCPLPINGKLREYIYHKPPLNAPDDFIVLECPIHYDGYKWTLLNIGNIRKGEEYIIYPPQKGTYRYLAFNRELGPEIRIRAIQELGITLSKDKICSFLPHLLNDDNWKIREAVINAIGYYQCKEAIPILQKVFMNEENANVKIAIGKVLIELNKCNN